MDDDLPYIATFTPWEQVLCAWGRLQAYDGQWQTSSEKFVLPKVDISPTFMTSSSYRTIPVGTNEYEMFNFLTDCFTEPARLEAKRFNEKLSPAEYWVQHSANMKQKHPGATPKQLRGALYAATIEVMNFRLTVAVSLYDMFLPHSVFDPCAGHGDRAIAAMSRSYIRSYIACEPNIASQKGIMNAVKIFSGDKNVCIHAIPFEDYLFDSSEFHDLVFTSPPYYDVEVYCNDETQSIMKHKTEKEWYARFLLLTFVRCWQHVTPNGHMVIAINNVINHRCGKMQFSHTEKLVHDLTAMCPSANFLGVVAFGNRQTKLEPMFVWHKEQPVVKTCTYKQLRRHRRQRRDVKRCKN